MTQTFPAKLTPYGRLRLSPGAGGSESQPWANAFSCAARSSEVDHERFGCPTQSFILPGSLMSDSEYNSHAVYVGSFDPLTLGHLDIITRGARIFEQLTVGIGVNPDKEALFAPDLRVALCEAAVDHLKNVNVTTFEGLSVEFVRRCKSRVLLRGVRSLADIDAEFTMSLANRVLDEEIESVFLVSSEHYNHISSSLIKQIARMAEGNVAERLKDFVPEVIIGPLLEQLKLD